MQRALCNGYICNKLSGIDVITVASCSGVFPKNGQFFKAWLYKNKNENAVAVEDEIRDSINVTIKQIQQ